MADVMFDAYCGLKCSECEYREKNNCGGCIATGGKPFYGQCELAKCAISRNVRFCGECDDFPCELLQKYSYDKDHGDNGARIEHCKVLKAEIEKQRKNVNPQPEFL